MTINIKLKEKTFNRLLDKVLLKKAKKDLLESENLHIVWFQDTVNPALSPCPTVVCKTREDAELFIKKYKNPYGYHVFAEPVELDRLLKLFIENTVWSLCGMSFLITDNETESYLGTMLSVKDVKNVLNKKMRLEKRCR